MESDARTADREEIARSAAAMSGGLAGKTFGIVGGVMTVAGVILVIVGLVAGHAAPPATVARVRKGTQVPPAASYRPGAELPGGILLLLGITFSGAGIPLRRAAAKARRIALTGVRAQGEVRSANPTGLLINRVRQYAIVVLVEPPNGAAPYEATAKVLGLQVTPGTRVPVLFDPADPKSIIVDRG